MSGWTNVKRHHTSSGIVSATLLALVLSVARCQGAFALETANQLKHLSIEELMDLDVTSVAKKVQNLFRAPAALTVITQEDIRRSGATSIPEILRMVPGLQVARIDNNKWAVSARGFNDQ